MFHRARGKARRAAARTFLGGLACIGVLLSLALPASATTAFPTTDDHSTTIATGAWWYHGLTGAQVNAQINQNHARLTQVRVEDPSVPTFDVTMVSDSGDYAVSGWWWYYNATADQVSALINQNNGRLISIDPYQTDAGLRFAVVMVSNTGAQARAWWWYHGVTADQIDGLLSQNNARLTALRPYLEDNGQEAFALIMIANTGIDFTGSEYRVGASAETIADFATNHWERVTEVTPDPEGGFDVILVSSEGEEWYWWYGVDAATVDRNLADHGTRLIDLTSYVVDGARKFAVVELGNNNATEAPINAASSSAQSYADANGWNGGIHGVYLISSKPGSKPIVAANSNFRYEPASSIKVLYLLYTLRQKAALRSAITYYWSGGPVNPNACPANQPERPSDAHVISVEAALAGMMQNSNNIYTRAFAIRWGLGPVEAMAQSLGMTNTHLNQPYIGCGFIDVPGGVRNELTLVDAAKLYAAVSNGMALSGTARRNFFNFLLGGAPSTSDPWGQAVQQVAAKLHKSAVVASFLADTNVRWKAGGYQFCLTGDSSCVPSKYDLSETGWISIPFIHKGKVVAHTYEYGDFVNDLPDYCGNCAVTQAAYNNLAAVAAHAATGVITKALKTWR
jgi:hypothetical protein